MERGKQSSDDVLDVLGWRMAECDRMRSGHLPLANIASRNDDHLTMLRHSVELEFGQGRVGMACVCSPMSSVWGLSWDVRSWAKEGNQWRLLDFGHNIWVDVSATCWNWQDLHIGDTLGIGDPGGKQKLRRSMFCLPHPFPFWMFSVSIDCSYIQKNTAIYILESNSFLMFTYALSCCKRRSSLLCYRKGLYTHSALPDGNLTRHIKVINTKSI